MERNDLMTVRAFRVPVNKSEGISIQDTALISTGGSRNRKDRRAYYVDTQASGSQGWRIAVMPVSHAFS